MVSGSWDKTIRVWDLKTGECTKILRAHVNGVRCLQVTGNTMVSGASGEPNHCLPKVDFYPDKIIFVWNLALAQCELILKGHEGGVYCLQFEVRILWRSTNICTGKYTCQRIWLVIYFFW